MKLFNHFSFNKILFKLNVYLCDWFVSSLISDLLRLPRNNLTCSPRLLGWKSLTYFSTNVIWKTLILHTAELNELRELCRRWYGNTYQSDIFKHPFQLHTARLAYTSLPKPIPWQTISQQLWSLTTSSYHGRNFLTVPHPLFFAEAVVTYQFQQ